MTAQDFRSCTQIGRIKYVGEEGGELSIRTGEMVVVRERAMGKSTKCEETYFRGINKTKQT